MSQQAKPVSWRGRAWPLAWRVAPIAVAVLVAATAGGKPAPRGKPGGIVVLDNCDPEYKGKETYEDNLSFLDAGGKLRSRVSGLNIAEEIGSPHRVAVDAERERVWVAEMVGNRLLQYDLAG